MCGDHVSLCEYVFVGMGSPPHVRGPLISPSGGGKFAGITPACAGTTNPFPAMSVRAGDHPRMCGDHK